MSNYPDNYNAERHDRRSATPEEVCPEAAAEVFAAQAAYREILTSAVAILRKHQLDFDLEKLAEAVSEQLADDVYESIRALDDEGFTQNVTGDNHAAFIAGLRKNPA